MFNRAHILATYMVPLLTVRVFTSKPFCFHDTDLLQVPQAYFLCLVAWSFVINSWTWKAFHDFFRGRPVAQHVKIRFGLFFIVRTIAKPANRIAENLYRFSIWTTSQNVPNLSLVSFHSKVGRLVNKRNPPGYWQVTASDIADLGQIISFYLGFSHHDSFTLGLAFS